jgi:hypothetical protein
MPAVQRRRRREGAQHLLELRLQLGKGRQPWQAVLDAAQRQQQEQWLVGGVGVLAPSAADGRESGEDVVRAEHRANRASELTPEEWVNRAPSASWALATLGGYQHRRLTAQWREARDAAVPLLKHPDKSLGRVAQEHLFVTQMLLQVAPRDVAVEARITLPSWL